MRALGVETELFWTKNIYFLSLLPLVSALSALFALFALEVVLPSDPVPGHPGWLGAAGVPGVGLEAGEVALEVALVDGVWLQSTELDMTRQPQHLPGRALPVAPCSRFSPSLAHPSGDHQ